MGELGRFCQFELSLNLLKLQLWRNPVFISWRLALLVISASLQNKLYAKKRFNFCWLANALRVKAWPQLNCEPEIETTSKICSISTITNMLKKKRKNINVRTARDLRPHQVHVFHYIDGRKVRLRMIKDLCKVMRNH